MNMRKNARTRTELLSRRRYICLHMIDDDTQGQWAKKRAYQARCSAQVRSGERTQESMFFIHPDIARTLTVRHCSDGF